MLHGICTLKLFYEARVRVVQTHADKPVTLEIQDPNLAVSQKIKQMQLKNNKTNGLGQCVAVTTRSTPPPPIVTQLNPRGTGAI